MNLTEKIWRQEGIKDVARRALAGRRLDEGDALRLFQVRNLHALAFLAGEVCRRLHGRRAYYIVNRHLNYSNLCVLSCPFCSFSRRKGEPGAFELKEEELKKRVCAALARGITEIHMVGGLHPDWPLARYEGLLKLLKGMDVRLHLKAFSAVEILHFSRKEGLSVARVLERLRGAGLDSLPGGGAEIFAPSVRRRICPGKGTSREWLAVHRTWHRLGGRSTATMLYGHVESLRDRVDHLRRLRRLQDETGGFLAFVPLPFSPANNAFSHLPGPAGFDSLRTLAVSRLYLDNINHLKCYWVGQGLKLAQVSLGYGVDDLDGTVMEEKIFHAAGSASPQNVTAADLERLIREAGREPVRRDSLYGLV
ncbi:MAG: aminofutalosine synthase MqnE [Verrucomicrobiae bacterium]|nr:aminofutalosine synthase MqnE [Verrucomicrobiae bacterium]